MSRPSRAYRRRVAVLMDSLRDDDLAGRQTVRLLRLDDDGLPESVLLFDPMTGRREKASLPLAADRVA